MAAQATASHITPKQLAADRANLRKARSVAKGMPRSARQRAASRHNLVHARAAKAARKHGVKYVSPVTARRPKAASLAVSGSYAGSPARLPEAPWLHSMPVCAAVAVAASLEYWTGTAATPDDILALHGKSSGEATLPELLELIAVEGFAGRILDSFHYASPDRAVPGLLYGLTVPAGYHAVLAVPAGVMSWGQELPWPGAPEEAWLLDWGPDGD
jgi:hypothetical protein